jgi:putative membrane protein
VDRVIQVVVNAAALWVAVQIVPGLDYDFTPSDAWWKFILVAVIFSLINTYLRPILRILTLPITLVTLGIFLLIINALMLLLTDAIAAELEIPLTVADFGAALLGSIVISIVGFILSMIVGTGRLAGRAL